MRVNLWRGALTALFGFGLLSCNESPTAPTKSARALDPRLTFAQGSAPQIVISQVYGGGGNSGSTYKNDFIELFNPGTAPVSVAGWSVQYASATTWQVTNLAGTIQPGAYYLVQEAAGNSAPTPLPTLNATGNIAMSANNGKVALVASTTAAAGSCPVAFIDEVSFGTATDCGHGVTGGLLATTAAIRNDGGCAFTGTGSDFTVAAPTPRNDASPTHICPAAPAQPVTVTVAPVTQSIPTGATQTFTATARDGATPPNVVSTTFTWASDHPEIATVDATTGVATAVAPGTAKITATASNLVSANATLTVTVPLVVDVVISQIYGGGGNSGAQYSNDYVELFNRGPDPVDITGWTVQYSSATSLSWSSGGVTMLPAGSIASGKYYLVQLVAGTTPSASLPTPDAVGSANMSGTAGKVILTTPGVAPTAQCPSGTGIVDRVGYGTSNCTASADWGGATAALSNTTAGFRKNDGCVKTGSLANDFIALPPNPHNSASPAKSCVPGAPRAQSTATLVINELMGDPANAESASWGEWFEVYNYGAQPIDLNGWTIVSGGTSQPDHKITSSVIVPAGGRAVLGRGADVTRNGGVTLDYNYFTGQSTTIWLDDSDFLLLLDGAGALADSVIWTSLPHGVTKALRDASQPHAKVDGANWGYSTTVFGDGDYGTPHDPNGTLADVAPVVSANKITLSGRTANDPTLPVGFEAQEFASEAINGGAPVTTTFSWTSLTPNLGSIDQNGVFHGLSAGSARFLVTATDGATRAFTITMFDAVASTTAQYGDNSAFGELTSGGSSNDFMIRRREYTTSFNGSRGILNWAAYDLNGTQIVSGQDRCDCFTFDPELFAAGFTRYTTADYTGAGAFAGFGIDRGHMVRSLDRTSGSLDNARTFYFANVVPQYADLNQGPWANMENYLGDLAQKSNKEVYIYVGPSGTSTELPVGSNGTVKNEGKITIPAFTWKVAAIMPRGKGPGDVHDYRDVSVIAAVMPNTPGIRNVDWQSNYVVTVDSVEKLTGYHFLSALPAKTQRALKTNTQPPLGALDGPYASIVGNSVSMSASTSIDPNGTIVGYAWDFGDGGVGAGSAATHTYSHIGSYVVRLVVTDNDNLADTVTTTAAINPRPAPSCGLGRFENAADSYACDPAPAGFYVAVTDATSPTPCAAGSYQPAIGQTSCLPAPLGSFVPTTGSLTATPCAIGTFSAVAGAQNCDAAPVGSFVSTTGASAATPCPVGMTTDAVGTTSASGCRWLPPAALTQLATDQLQQMVSSGQISSADANPISVSIDQAQKSIEKGNLTAARNQLGAAVNKVEAAVRSGKITASQGAVLIAALNLAIAHM